MGSRTEIEDLIVFEMRKEKPNVNDESTEDEEKGLEDDDDEVQKLDTTNTDDDEIEHNDDGFIAEDSAAEAETNYKKTIENADDDQMSDVKPDLKSLNAPRRYLLFDELVAIVVDYDQDGTPIVEFALADNGSSDEKLPLECGICPNVMHKSKLAAHLKTHQVPGTNRYACIYCDETYKDYKYLAGHARRHMGIRPYVCEPCKLYFSTKQDLRVHNQRRHHTKEHVCEQCGKSFAQNTMLKRHRESTHEKKRRFQCEHCPKAYYKNFSLQEHVRAVHMGKRRMLVCPFCGMQCRDAHKMARHRKQFHLHQKQFVCEICHEEFTDINYFDAHKRSIQCRNNTRRRLEEDQDVNLQATEESIEDDGDEGVQEIEECQLNDDTAQDMLEEHEEYTTNILEENVDQVLDQSQQDEGEVIIYELDLEDD